MCAGSFETVCLGVNRGLRNPSNNTAIRSRFAFHTHALLLHSEVFSSEPGTKEKKKKKKKKKKQRFRVECRSSAKQNRPRVLIIYPTP